MAIETQMNRPGPLKAEGSWSNVFSYHTMDIEVAKSEGIYFYDVNGNKYIDASGGPMGTPLGNGLLKLPKPKTIQRT